MSRCISPSAWSVSPSSSPEIDPGSAGDAACAFSKAPAASQLIHRLLRRPSFAPLGNQAADELTAEELRDFAKQRFVAP
jgi:hypothetical protein